MLLEKYTFPAGNIDVQIVLSEVQTMNCRVRYLFEIFLCGDDKGYHATVGDIIGLNAIDVNYPLAVERSIRNLMHVSGPYEVSPNYRRIPVVDVSARMLVEDDANAVHAIDAFFLIDEKVKLVMGVLEKLEEEIPPEDMFWSA